MCAQGTAERIIAAAADLFAERGYAGTTTRAIAERAGVNEVTLFRRFENKQGVLRALGMSFREKAAARSVSALPDPADAHATLLQIARNEIAQSIESGGVALRLAFDATTVPEIAEVMGDGPKGNLDELAGYIADRQAAGLIRDDIPALVIAEAFASLTSSYVMYRMVMGFLETPEDVIADETVAQLFEVFWSGAVKRGEA